MLGPLSKVCIDFKSPVSGYSAITPSETVFSDRKPTPTARVSELFRPLISKNGVDRTPKLSTLSMFSNRLVQDPRLSPVLLPLYFVSLIFALKTSLLVPASRLA
uniref:Uncharacterized protein n=1 Tax=Opuntia streptacantha TaxID=393608 RepID=A0A7C8Z4M8_OPUST